MKKVLYLSLLLFAFTLTNCGNANNDKQTEIASVAKNMVKEKNDDAKLKRYLVKSGIILYKTSTTGKVMGSTISGSGTEEIYFKDWGAVELKKSDNKKVTKMNIFGQKKTDVVEEHTINKLDNGKSYSVDTNNKVIYLRRDPAMEMMKTFNGGDVVDPGKKMLESMGGKIIGKEKILGYTCDLWEIPGGKQWIYKGLPLKLEMTVMGVTSKTEATSAKFNVAVPDKYFELPDYPIQKEEGYQNDEEYAQDKAEMKKQAAKMKNMTFEQYKAMVHKEDPETRNMSDEELKMGYQIMKKIANNMSN
jgi:hypothetical protein